MPNITASSPLWLFDLDNTLHDASHAIFPSISANMNTFIARVLGDGVTNATQAQVDAARIGYWKRYGATLLGLIKHHQVSAAQFLHMRRLRLFVRRIFYQMRFATNIALLCIFFTTTRTGI